MFYFQEMGYGELEFEYDKDLSSEKTVDYLFLGMGVSAKSNAWAGPDHWKYRRVKGGHIMSLWIFLTATII
jgi:hypothetical protein